jgi:hypothetical protein
MHLLALLLGVYALLLPSVQAWGADGHAIVATLAQAQLHPLVRKHLCSILPNATSYWSAWPREGAPHLQ